METDKATLEQLEELKLAGIAGIPFPEAIANMGDEIDICDTTLIEQLRIAHNMGDKENEKTLEPKISQEDKEHNTKQFADLKISGMINLLYQANESTQKEISQEFLSASISEAVKKMQSGDTTEFLNVLTTNLMQIQLFNGKITGNISQKEMSYKNWELLSKMQMRLLQESRKTVMAINEICNPKRTTFVKNAIQNNNLNSEKKPDIINELNKPNEMEVIDAEMDTASERVAKGTD